MRLFFCIQKMKLVNTTKWVIKMNGFMWIISIILLLIFFILISNIKIQIKLKKEDKDDRIEVDGWILYRLIHIKKRIPIIVFDSPNEGIKYKSHSNFNNQSEIKKNRITHRKIKKWKVQFTDLIEEIHDLSEAFKGFLRKVHILKLQWNTRIGLEEAALTGVSAGVIWGVKGTLIGLASKYMVLEGKPEIQVVPQFDQLLFNTYLNAVFRFRIISVVWMGFKIFFGFIKAKLHSFFHSGYSKLYESFKRM